MITGERKVHSYKQQLVTCAMLLKNLSSFCDPLLGAFPPRPAGDEILMIYHCALSR